MTCMQYSMYSVYVVCCAGRNARAQDKFLLQAETLSVRQLDTVKSLVRLGSLLTLAPPLSTLAQHMRTLTTGRDRHLRAQ